jgi:hypothetical protein
LQNAKNDINYMYRFLQPTNTRKNSMTKAAPTSTQAAPNAKAAPAQTSARAPAAKKRVSATSAAPARKAVAKRPVAAKKAAPVRTAAAKTVAKPPSAAPTAASAKPAAAPTAAATIAAGKLAKDKKPKMVRDSVTIPKAEYLVLEAMKQRAAQLKVTVKKTELIRAGMKHLATLPDAVFLAAIAAVPSLKTGRPSKA